LTDGSPSDWAQQYELTHPVMNDNNRDVWSVYGEGYIPLNIVIGPDFVIRYKKAGYSESEIVSIIDQYMPSP